MELIAFLWDESAWFLKENPDMVIASDYMHRENDLVFVCDAKQVINLHLTEEPQLVVFKVKENES